jgi:D-lyxose ketol-isomerase
MLEQDIFACKGAADMKRSEINAAIRRMAALAAEHGFSLPPFCGWTPGEWLLRGHEYDEIRDTMLGWDVTDYGTGNFAKTGFTLVTLRNGSTQKSEQYKKTYAEKLLMLEVGQYSPMHFHWFKMEDIINRGGGTVLIRVYNATPDEQLADTAVKVMKDGRAFAVPAGTQVRLAPGESITIYPLLYHDFEIAPGSGAALLGEVSMTNDDARDNRFLEPLGRFPVIEEDALPYRLLCSEYPTAKE